MIICADDYGLNSNINMAILDLAQHNKVNAVSVLINRASLKSINDLAALSHKIKIGLHLELGNIEKQINLFFKSFGFYPNYYDGHRHCHIYPFVSTRLIKKIKQLPTHPFYIRSLGLRPELMQTTGVFNRFYVSALIKCNRAFIKKLKENDIATNDFLYGSINNHMNIETIFELFKKHRKENDIFFFHPSLMQEKCKIPRRHEYEYIRQN